jgi:hypothetical protein
MIDIKLTPELKVKYPESIFGSLFVMNVPMEKCMKHWRRGSVKLIEN